MITRFPYIYVPSREIIVPDRRVLHPRNPQLGGLGAIAANRRRSAGGFTPASLGSSVLKLWLKGDNAPSGSIATWSDDSGNSNNQTQATSGKRPTRIDSTVNGHHAVRFDGSDDNLDGAGIASAQSAFTWFAIMKPTTNATFYRYFAFGTNGPQMWQASNQSDCGIVHGGTVDLTAGTPIGTAWTCITGRLSGTNLQLYKNGTSIGLNSSFSFSYTNDATTIGKGQGFDEYASYDLAELVFTNTALSTGGSGDLQNVGTYLGALYGLTITF